MCQEDPELRQYIPPDEISSKSPPREYVLMLIASLKWNYLEACCLHASAQRETLVPWPETDENIALSNYFAESLMKHPVSILSTFVNLYMRLVPIQKQRSCRCGFPFDANHLLKTICGEKASVAGQHCRLEQIKNCWCCLRKRSEFDFKDTTCAEPDRQCAWVRFRRWSKSCGQGDGWLRCSRWKDNEVCHLRV